MGVHLDIDGCGHRGLSKADVKVHTAIKPKRTLVIRSGYLIGLNEISLY